MLSLRRPDTEARIELMPLIDVIFLILTFFIYAMVLMDRIEMVPMELRTLESGGELREQEPPPALTLSLDANGELFLDREPIAIGAVVPTLEAAIAERSDTVLYLAVSDEMGDTDRVPMLLEIWDRLRAQDMPVKMVGKPVSTALPATAEENDPS